MLILKDKHESVDHQNASSDTQALYWPEYKIKQTFNHFTVWLIWLTINKSNKQKTYTCGGVYGNENPAQNQTNVHRLKEIDWCFSFTEVLLKLTINTCNSNVEIAMPELAPEPARPMKWPEPILLANKEAPTYSKGSITLLRIA